MSGDAAPRTVFAVPAKSGYRPSPHGVRNKLARALWGIAAPVLFRPTPKPLYGWRRGILRLFGARIAPSAIVHPSVRIWAPWNLEMAAHACLSPHVECYSVDRIAIGTRATVSQFAFLCTATHDADHSDMPLVTAPIVIEADAWIAADAFVGPGVRIGEGAVVGARSAVFKDVPAWTIVAGAPARFLRPRRRPSADPHPHSEDPS
jgi:putative colanic acid biosynthesis acetyltransferase WcaF